jgi:uncharacterized membrane protein
MLKNIFKAIRTNVLIGLVLITPIVATILIVKFLFDLATKWITEYEFFQEWVGDTAWEIPLQAAVLIVVLCVFYLIGLLARNVIGRHLYRISDKMLAGMPLVKGIYVAVRQISAALFTQRKTLFKQAVVIEYPRKGAFSVAFVTSRLEGDMAGAMLGAKVKEPCLSLFVPTTPNPTSGFLLIVPERDTIPLNVPVGEALTFVMSAGAVVPGRKGTDETTLLDKLEALIKQTPEPEKTIDAS